MSALLPLLLLITIGFSSSSPCDYATLLITDETGVIQMDSTHDNCWVRIQRPDYSYNYVAINFLYFNINDDYLVITEDNTTLRNLTGEISSLYFMYYNSLEFILYPYSSGINGSLSFNFTWYRIPALNITECSFFSSVYSPSGILGNFPDTPGSCNWNFLIPMAFYVRIEFLEYNLTHGDSIDIDYIGSFDHINRPPSVVTAVEIPFQLHFASTNSIKAGLAFRYSSGVSITSGEITEISTGFSTSEAVTTGMGVTCTIRCLHGPICTDDIFDCWSGNCSATDVYYCIDYACHQLTSECDFSNGCPIGKIGCWDGECQDNLTQCLKVPKCPAETYRCNDSRCVSDIQNCPSTTCPSFVCPDGQCVENKDLCTPWDGCAPNVPYQCQNGACATSPSECDTVGISNTQIFPLDFYVNSEIDNTFSVMDFSRTIEILNVYIPMWTFSDNTILQVRSTPHSKLSTQNLNPSSQIISPLVDLNFLDSLEYGKTFSIQFSVTNSQAGTACVGFINDDGMFECGEKTYLGTTGENTVSGNSNRQRGSYAVLFEGREAENSSSSEPITGNKLWIIGAVGGVILVAAIVGVALFVVKRKDRLREEKDLNPYSLKKDNSFYGSSLEMGPTE